MSSANSLKRRFPLAHGSLAEASDKYRSATGNKSYKDCAVALKKEGEKLLGAYKGKSVLFLLIRSLLIPYLQSSLSDLSFYIWCESALENGRGNQTENKGG